MVIAILLSVTAGEQVAQRMIEERNFPLERVADARIPETVLVCRAGVLGAVTFSIAGVYGRLVALQIGALESVSVR